MTLETYIYNYIQIFMHGSGGCKVDTLKLRKYSYMASK